MVVADAKGEATSSSVHVPSAEVRDPGAAAEVKKVSSSTSLVPQLVG